MAFDDEHTADWPPSEHSDLQQKIRDAIKQGHISAEDFNGDPWMNKPGQRGIRGKKPKDWDDGEVC